MSTKPSPAAISSATCSAHEPPIMPVARNRTTRARLLRLDAEHRHDAQEVVDVLELLERLAREEPRAARSGASYSQWPIWMPVTSP